ncbi:MAG: DUF2282 domain-containing protein [Rhodospirillaceae bacterium]|nr:DUF2282 domain-containing protein [Rhodospirillaceae bacterium]
MSWRAEVALGIVITRISLRALAAVAAGAALAAAPAIAADAKGKEKCYGVAKAGENGCAAANGTHSCGGLSKINYSGQEWKLVPAGTCEKMGGKLMPFEGPSPLDPALNKK